MGMYNIIGLASYYGTVVANRNLQSGASFVFVSSLLLLYITINIISICFIIRNSYSCIIINRNISRRSSNNIFHRKKFDFFLSIIL